MRRSERKGPAVAQRLAERLGLPAPEGAWHVQRDAWIALGCELALLCGSLGKIGRDLALLSQGEVGEVAEPTRRGARRLVGDAEQAQPGRGDDRDRRGDARAASRRRACWRRWRTSTSAASAAGRPSSPSGRRCSWRRTAAWSRSPTRAPGWPSTRRGCAPTSSASAAPSSPRRAAALLAPTLGKAKAQELLARLSARAIAEDTDLRTLLRAEPALAAVDAVALDAAFDIDAAARQAGGVATAQLDRLAERVAAKETSDDH